MRFSFVATLWSLFGRNDKAFVVFWRVGVGSGEANLILTKSNIVFLPDINVN